jgi:hypothetical protein
MSERLIKLLAELEYLRALGQYLIRECDNVLEDCRTQEHTIEHLDGPPELQN